MGSRTAAVSVGRWRRRRREHVYLMGASVQGSVMYRYMYSQVHIARMTWPMGLHVERGRYFDLTRLPSCKRGQRFGV